MTNKLENETKKRRPIDKNTRFLVWEKYNKKAYEGKCYCCGDTIYFKSFHVGHNKAVAKSGNNNISNLRPICASCNQSMKTMSIEEYRNLVGSQSSESKKKSEENESKVTKRELLKNLATGKLETLTKVFNLEPKLPIWPEREDYIKVLASSRKVTVENIKSILRI